MLSFGWHSLHTTCPCRLLLQAGEEPYPYPSVHAPWYGYLFWTIATAGGYGKAVDTSFVAANIEHWDKCAANIKVRGWPDETGYH